MRTVLSLAAVLVSGVSFSPAPLDFVLRNSASPAKHLIETMAGGVAVLDYNKDGRPDLYFVNGALQPKLDKSDPSYFNRLYRNDGGKFTDVTLAAGVKGEGYGIGAAAADYDNDGFTDLFVAGVNRNLLFRNRGDGTFEDVTVKAGLAPKGRQPWSVGAGWFDYDNDGRLDLFVVNYVAWDPAKEPFCGDLIQNYRTYCHPKYYDPLPNALYHNNGDGTFSDVSEPSGIAAHPGKGMSVSFADYDRDGRPDIFVANDAVPNFLFHNEGNGRFREMGLTAGVALNEDGRAVSSMGSDWRDIDNDGREDLFFTALSNETFPLFRSLGDGTFMDITYYPSGAGRITLPFSGWSAGIVDFDNDGYKDLFAACGDVNDNTELFSSRQSRQRNLLMRNLDGRKFEDAGASFQEPGRHRGAAFADFDQDGRVDVVVTRLDGRAVLYRNTTANGNHWLALRLTGRRGNRDAIGARIRVLSASGRQQWNHVTTAVGYASSSDRTVYFGLGKDAGVKLVEIEWPGGARQRLEAVTADRYLSVAEP